MRKFKLLISTVAAALIVSVQAFAQNITVKGVVSDENGDPVPSAAVLVAGTTKGTTTNLDGSYSIAVPSNGSLVFSSIGYAEQNVAVNGQSVINVVLMEDAEYLDETIVVAYGTATKSSFTGSAAMVKSDVIEKKIATNVTSALAGTTPGVQLFSASGDPTGNSASIRIRGFGSYLASSAPLLIVDGAPYQGSISDINPSDVESMSVLKDAAAAAIYGNRGANGVILITTKKGKIGEAVVKFDAKVGVNSRLIPNYDVIDDPAEYYETWYKLLYGNYYYSGHSVAESYAYADKNLLDETNGGLGYQVYTVPAGELFIGRNFKLNPNATLGYSDGTYYYTPDDWYAETYHNSVRKEYNVSASGATNRFNYFASAGYLDDTGIINNSEFQRYTARVNAEYQAKKWLKFSTNMSFTHSQSESANFGAESWGSSGNLFYIVNTMAPIYPLYVRTPILNDAGDVIGSEIMKENGRTVYDALQTNFKRAAGTGNAVRDNEYNRSTRYDDVFSGKWGVVATPFRGLTLTANLSATSDIYRTNTLYSVFGSGSSVDGQASVSSGRNFFVNEQYLAEYKKAFGANSFDVLFGYEKYHYISQGLSGSSTRLFDPFIGEINNGDGPKTETNVASSTNKFLTEGFFVRGQYDHAGKYFASASFRRDASSRFAEGHRWGNFWSVGAAWLVSQEDFLKNVSWVDMLKFKVSYGEQGNDDLGSLFPYSDQYSHSYNPETKTYSLRLTYKGNPEITWETNANLNAGVDFELFGGRLNGSVEAFTRTTRDLLYSKDVPLSAGNPTGSIYVNVGELKNTGIEASFDGSIISNKNFLWTWNANVGHYKNEFTKLDESVPEEGLPGSYSIIKVGGSRYNAYMYKFAGVDEQTGKALYYYKDEDGVVNTTDDFGKATKFDLGTVLPKLYGGFGTSFNAYGFDLSVQFSYQLGGKFYDGTYQQLMLSQNQAGNAIHKDIRNAWTPENTKTDVPRLDADYSVGQSAIDRFLISSNYLSLNNVTLGYTLPRKLVNAISLQSARVYVAGENLAVLSARKGVDPRFSTGIGSFQYGSGAAQSYYSAMRTVTAGITLTF